MRGIFYEIDLHTHKNEIRRVGTPIGQVDLKEIPSPIHKKEEA